eukprot:5068634-Pleurochrysis_carterae.AAC.1
MRYKDVHLNNGNTCGFRIVPTYTCIRDATSACLAPRRLAPPAWRHGGAAGQRWRRLDVRPQQSSRAYWQPVVPVGV